MYTEDELKQLAELCIEKDIVAIADEIYVEFTWGNHKHRSLIGMKGMEERTLVLMSFSKTFAWTGLRAGFVLGGPELMRYVGAVPTGICSMPVPFQYAAAKALTTKEGWDFVSMMKNQYYDRVKYFVKRANEMPGISCAMPEGTFYTFPDVSGLGIPNAEFSRYLNEDGSIGRYIYEVNVPADRTADVEERIIVFLERDAVIVEKDAKQKDSRPGIEAIAVKGPALLEITIQDSEIARPRIQDVIEKLFDVGHDLAVLFSIKRTAMFVKENGAWMSPMDVK